MVRAKQRIDDSNSSQPRIRVNQSIDDIFAPSLLTGAIAFFLRQGKGGKEVAGAPWIGMLAFVPKILGAKFRDLEAPRRSYRRTAYLPRGQQREVERKTYECGRLLISSSIGIACSEAINSERRRRILCLYPAWLCSCS